MKAIDFFCGGGGLTRGLLDAGIAVVAGIDHDDKCRTTYEYNNPGVSFVTQDIRSVTLADLTAIASKHGTSLSEMLFAGCAPCQTFSQQRRQTTKNRDATLLAEFGRLVNIARPAVILIENVPGLARVKGYSTFRRFLRLLSAAEYNYDYAVVDAKHFGVPQSRRRLILIAAKRTDVQLPKPKYGAERPFYTVRRAIEHFPPLEAGSKHAHIPNHVTATITPLNIRRLKKTPLDGGDRRSWPKSLRLSCHSGDYTGHTDVYGRMSWDSPAPTLTGRCHSISNGRYGHPTQDRAISLREAAALQSFPDAYQFFGSNKHVALQIGNAVPVRLAEELGKHLLALAKGKDVKKT